jgi:hypothetical protein
MEPLKITSMANPRWANADHTAIELDVTFDGLDGTHGFCAVANDSEEHGRQAFTDAVAGKFGSIGDYIAPPPPPEPTVQQKLKAKKPSMDELFDMIAGLQRRIAQLEGGG